MDGLLQHRHVLQAGRVIKKVFGDTPASAVRTEAAFISLSHPNRDKSWVAKKEHCLSTQPYTTIFSCGGAV